MVLARVLFQQDTFLKQRPLQSSQLPNYELQKIPVGTALVLQSYAIPPDHPDHYKLGLSKIQFPIRNGSSSTWFAYEPHVDINQSFTPVTTVGQIARNQKSDSIVKIYADRQIIGSQQGFLKLVVNQDTVIKRDAVSSDILDPSAKQDLPAGTELILLTSPPNSSNVVTFTLDRSHVKFTLKDIAFKGFNQNWYAYTEHVGIQLV